MKKIFLVLTAAALILSAGCRNSNTETVSSEVISEHGSSVSSVQEYESSTQSSEYEKTQQIIEKSERNSFSDKSTASTDNINVSNEKTQCDPECISSSNMASADEPREIISETADTNLVAENHHEADDYDEIWIANKVFELLNEERKAAGIHTREMLTGLNKVAVLRSEQLVTQFSHKWIDEDGNEWSGAQYASTVLEYGKKEQSSIYDPDTGTVTPIDEYYYDYGGTENCYYGGTAVKSKSETAESIVNSFKGSQTHWSSLMSSSMYYDGIGITFSNGMVYCSVNSSAENYG